MTQSPWFENDAPAFEPGAVHPPCWHTLALPLLPPWVAVDDTQVFWTNQGDSTLNVAPVTGGTPTTLFRYPVFVDGPVGVAVGP